MAGVENNRPGAIMFLAAMRPAILFPLFAEIRTLSGVGPKLEKLIAKVAGPRLVDLIFDLPVGVMDRSYRPKLIAAEPGRIATVEVGVLDHLPPRVKSQPYKVRVSDDTAMMELVFFRADAEYLMDILPPGSRRMMSRPHRDTSRTGCRWPIPIMWWRRMRSRRFPQHEPVYALTEGLPPSRWPRRCAARWRRCRAMPEWQDAAFLKQRRLRAFQCGAGGGACARA